MEERCVSCPNQATTHRYHDGDWHSSCGLDCVGNEMQLIGIETVEEVQAAIKKLEDEHKSLQQVIVTLTAEYGHLSPDAPGYDADEIALRSQMKAASEQARNVRVEWEKKKRILETAKATVVKKEERKRPKVDAQQARVEKKSQEDHQRQLQQATLESAELALQTARNNLRVAIVMQNMRQTAPDDATVAVRQAAQMQELNDRCNREYQALVRAQQTEREALVVTRASVQQFEQSWPHIKATAIDEMRSRVATSENQYATLRAVAGLSALQRPSGENNRGVAVYDVDAQRMSSKKLEEVFAKMSGPGDVVGLTQAEKKAFAGVLITFMTAGIPFLVSDDQAEVNAFASAAGKMAQLTSGTDMEGYYSSIRDAWTTYAQSIAVPFQLVGWNHVMLSDTKTATLYPALVRTQFLASMSTERALARRILESLSELWSPTPKKAAARK